MKIVFGIDEGLGNIIQCEPAIACLRAAGLNVYATKTGNWKGIWTVLEGRVDGFVDNGDPEVTDFICSMQWRRGAPKFPNARVWRKPYTPINEVEFNFMIAQEFYYKTFKKNLRSFNAPELALKYEATRKFPAHIKPRNMLAVQPAKSKSNAWRNKHYNAWEDLIAYLIINATKPVLMGTLSDAVSISKILNGLKNHAGCSIGDMVDARADSWTPLQHAQFLIDNCYALITSEGGWGFLGAAIGIPTFILWGPNILYRNKPMGSHVHAIFNSDCQECLDVQAYNSKFPVCPFNNKCMDHKPASILHAVYERG